MATQQNSTEKKYRLMRLTDRGLGELGLLFGLIGVAGVGVPMIWPDEKGIGIPAFEAAEFLDELSRRLR